MTAGAAATEPFGAAYLLPSVSGDEAECARLELLQRLCDPYSRQLLGTFVEPGMRCLEVGAGLGSMSRWLVQQVGASGHVVASDKEPSALDAPGCEVRRHDIVTDAPDALGLASFDLVYCRHVLEHLFAHSVLIVGRLLELARPGGTVVIEGTGAGFLRAANPWHPSAAAFDRFSEQTAAVLGARFGWGHYVPALMMRCGLGEVRHTATATVHTGGSEVAQLILATSRAFARSGADASPGRALFHECLIDPAFLFFGPLEHATAGRRANRLEH
jgi:SAM-dependent methyltransferase